MLLKGTPLEPQVDRSGAISIVYTKTAFASRTDAGAFESNGEKENEKVTAVETSGPAIQEAAGGNTTALQEVVVTAQKKTENLTRRSRASDRDQRAIACRYGPTET